MFIYSLILDLFLLATLSRTSELVAERCIKYWNDGHGYQFAPTSKPCVVGFYANYICNTIYDYAAIIRNFVINYMLCSVVCQSYFIEQLNQNPFSSFYVKDKQKTYTHHTPSQKFITNSYYHIIPILF